MEKELSFLKCEKCGSGDLDTIENFEQNTFKVTCKKCGHVIHEGLMVINGPSFIDAGEEVEDIPQLTKEEIKKLDSRTLMENYIFGEVCDKYFVEELISRLYDCERVIRLLNNGLKIKIDSKKYKVSDREFEFPYHQIMLGKLGWSEKDYALVRKTLKKIK